MKTILLFGAGKSATVLIDYLIKETEINKWKFIIADCDKAQILLKTNNSKFAEAVELNIEDEKKRTKLIERAHVVISMMPPDLHFIIAKDCVEYRKHLLTASYLDKNIKSLQDEINHRKLLFICEMGLDPGIDHMSAMQLFHKIKEKGGELISFKSHCGGLVAPEDDDNPWHYKISWNPRNVVMAGKAGAEYLENNKNISLGYEQLFENKETVLIDDETIGELSFYPNRDSLSYLPVYQLKGLETFVRTTLRYPGFITGWSQIIALQLTNEEEVYETDNLSLKDFFILHLQKNNLQNEVAKADDAFKTQLDYIGYNDAETLINKGLCSAATVLQFMLETKLSLRPSDKDMIVMLHQIEYNLNNQKHKIESTLIVKGQDSLRTAMAKTVGLPLGIAAKLILNGNLNLRGLHIPILPAIYNPVLSELEKEGIQFKETETVLNY